MNVTKLSDKNIYFHNSGSNNHYKPVTFGMSPFITDKQQIIFYPFQPIIGDSFRKKILDFETNNIYKPSKFSSDDKIQQIHKNLIGKFKEISIKTPDNETLSGWYFPATSQNKPTIVVAHGNTGNILKWQRLPEFLSEKGYGVLFVDYRGYGSSTGTPSEQGVYTDIESSVKYLVNNEKISPDNIILLGHSLGGSVVSEVATRTKVRSIILLSTFTNMLDSALNARKLNLLTINDKTVDSYLIKNLPKLERLLTQKFDTEAKLGKIPPETKMLIIHSKVDGLLPVEMAEKLASKRPDNTELIIRDKGAHGEIEWAEDDILRFLDSINNE